MGSRAGHLSPYFRHLPLLLVLLSFLLAVAPAIARTGRAVPSLSSREADDLEEELGAVRDPALAGWVDRIGTKIVRVGGGDPRKYTFGIVDDDDVNAFALPGGSVYVTMGLLRFVDSEEELASVMGHEIAHITAHHGEKRFERDVLLTIGLTLLRAYVPATIPPAWSPSWANSPPARSAGPPSSMSTSRRIRPLRSA